MKKVPIGQLEVGDNFWLYKDKSGGMYKVENHFDDMVRVLHLNTGRTFEFHSSNGMYVNERKSRELNLDNNTTVKFEERHDGKFDFTFEIGNQSKGFPFTNEEAKQISRELIEFVNELEE